MLNQLEKAFFDVATGRVIVILYALLGGVVVSVSSSRSFAAMFPYGLMAGLFLWSVCGWLLAKRRVRRQGNEQRRMHV